MEERDFDHQETAFSLPNLDHFKHSSEQQQIEVQNVEQPKIAQLETTGYPKIEHPRKTYSIDSTVKVASLNSSSGLNSSVNSNFSSESLNSGAATNFSPPNEKNNNAIFLQNTTQKSADYTQKPTRKFTRRNSLIGLFSRNSFSTMVSAQCLQTWWG